MKKRTNYLFIIVFLLGIQILNAQQKSIPRIDQMSDKPETYKLIDWKKLTKDYDNLVLTSIE